jgi:hypothetical protein
MMEIAEVITQYGLGIAIVVVLWRGAPVALEVLKQHYDSERRQLQNFRADQADRLQDAERKIEKLQCDYSDRLEQVVHGYESLVRAFVEGIRDRPCGNGVVSRIDERTQE